MLGNKSSLENFLLTPSIESWRVITLSFGLTSNKELETWLEATPHFNQHPEDAWKSRQAALLLYVLTKLQERFPRQVKEADIFGRHLNIYIFCPTQSGMDPTYIQCVYYSAIREILLEKYSHPVCSVNCYLSNTIEEVRNHFSRIFYKGVTKKLVEKGENSDTVDIFEFTNPFRWHLINGDLKK